MPDTHMPPHASPNPAKSEAASSLPPIGAKPADAKDPQARKFDLHDPIPPKWEKAADPLAAAPPWDITPELEPLGRQHPPKGFPADDMTSPEEQRARSAWLEENGMAKYLEAVDQRPKEDRPHFVKDAIALGGALMSASPGKQVPGVSTPKLEESRR